MPTVEVKPTAPTTTTVAPDVPRTETPPAPTQTPEDAARFAQLAKREKMIRAKAQEMEQREIALKEREAKLAAPKEVPWQDRFKQDPLSVMNELGMSYEDLLNRMVNTSPADLGLLKLQKEIEAMKTNQTEVLSKLEKQQQESYQQAVKQIETEVSQLVKSLPDDFEQIKIVGKNAEKAVTRYIQKTFEEEGYLMDVSEAAKAVEEYLTEEALTRAKAKKIQTKLTPTQAAAQGLDPKAKHPVQQTTLSHSMTAQTKPLNKNERRERAILAFQGKLTE